MKTVYRELLRAAIVGTHDPENVVLMEIDPREQKTLPDFLLTEKMLGVRTVDIEAIKKQGGNSITNARASAYRSGESTTAPSSTSCNASR